MRVVRPSTSRDAMSLLGGVLSPWAHLVGHCLECRRRLAEVALGSDPAALRAHLKFPYASQICMLLFWSTSTERLFFPSFIYLSVKG